MSSVVTMNDHDPLFSDALYTEALPLEAIHLMSHQIQQALDFSQSDLSSDQQWQAYLNALARIGFEQWLQERSPALNVTLQQQVLPSDPESSLCLSILQVNDYRVGLIAIGSSTGDRVSIPRLMINSPDSTPHLYVLVEVWEEQNAVHIYGHLRHDQLLMRQASSPHSTDIWLYLDWFDADADTLLLYLRCLNPDAVLSPEHQPSMATVAETRSQTALTSHDSPTPAINVSCWLRDRLDEVAQELSWVLLPPLAITFRNTATPAEQFDTVTTELLKQGIALPPQARAAYQNLAWEDVALRLYAVTWQESQEAEIPEWSLLLILGAQPGYELPVGTTLNIADDQQMLDQQILRERQPDAYLFTRVIGAWYEQFRVTINLDNNAIIRLLPFRFQPTV